MMAAIILIVSCIAMVMSVGSVVWSLRIQRRSAKILMNAEHVRDEAMGLVVTAQDVMASQSLTHPRKLQ